MSSIKNISSLIFQSNISRTFVPVCVLITLVMSFFASLPPFAWGQYYSNTPQTTTGFANPNYAPPPQTQYDSASYSGQPYPTQNIPAQSIPAQSAPVQSGQSQFVIPGQVAQTGNAGYVSPVGSAAVSSNSTYGGVAVASPQYSQSGTTIFLPAQNGSPDTGTAVQQTERMPIQREQTTLAESDPVFDGEVENILNRLQNTPAPEMEIQTFQRGSAAMVPSGIETLQPLESERETAQFQSQVMMTPSATTGNTAPMFGAGMERSLAETQEEQLDFGAIMQAQQAANHNSRDSLTEYELQGRASDSRTIEGTQRTLADREAENLPVLDIVIDGNGRIPQYEILKQIKTMKGEPFQIQTVQEDARTLNQTGCFFSVTPRYQRKADGVIVHFDLVERPVFHSIRYIGCNKIKKQRLTEETGLKPGDPVDVTLVMQAREKIKAHYQSEGFERASVVIASGDKSTDRNVVFIINEGVKQRVLDTEIVGGKFLSNARLKTLISSKPGIFYYIGGEFNREKLDADVTTLLDYYKLYGFLNVQIDRVFEEGDGYWGVSEPGSWIKVKFIISEGPRYKVNSIKFDGNTMFSDEELLKDFKLKPGQDYLKTAYEIDKAGVKRKYGNKGHVFANVDLQINLIVDKPGEVDFIYTIDEDQPVMISSINVDFGDQEESHTKTTTILKHMFNIKPGSIVTADKIKNAENSITRPGFLNVNPSEGQTPKISIERESDHFNDDEMIDEEMRDIDSLTVRGQSPYGFSYHAVPPEHRVAYPQTNDTGLVSSSPYGSTGSIGVQQGGYTVPESYQGYQGTTPTVRPGSMPRLPVDTNAAAMSAPGLFGQNDTTYATGNANSALLAPSSPYNNGVSGSVNGGTNGNISGQYVNGQYVGGQYDAGQYGTQTGMGNTNGMTTGVTGTPDNQIIPATTNPYNYYGDTGHGSIAPASGMFPSDGTYNELGAPGSVTRPLYGHSWADVIVRVQEGKTGNVTMSVGINSDSGLMGKFSIEERNFDWRKLPTNPWTLAGWRNAFRGAGQRFLLEAMPGENYQRYMISFQEPLLGNTRFSLGLNASYYTRYYDEWRERRTGGGVSIGRAWTERFSTSLSFNGANIKIYDPYPIPDLYEVLGNNGQYAFGISGTYDSRDSSLLPTEGGTLTVTAEQVLGTSQFVRGGYDARRYFVPFGLRRGDGSGPWVIGLRSAANITESTTPIYERYYAGGFSTIRGFEYRGVTPRWNGFGVGGNFEFYNSIELCFPISADDNIRGVVFVDSGTVEKSIGDWENEYRVAPGVGIRLSIPMMGPVPIAFDFAFPINKNKGDITQTFTFNMGFSR